MHETAYSNAAPTAVVVTLDDCLVEVPPAIASSLTDVCELLERVALRSGRVLANVMVDGTNRETTESFSQTKSFRCVEAKTVSLHTFAGAVTERISTRLNNMSAKVEQAVLLVLINNREFARAAWQNWLGELRAILIEFNFLEELGESPLSRASVDRHTLARHLEALHVINALAGVLLTDEFCPWDAGQAAAFSTVCERHFLLWLNRLRWFSGQAAKAYVNHVAAK